MIDLPPPVRILLKMAELGRGADYSQAIPAAGRPVTVRHARNRKPVRGEKPAISLILVSDEPQPDEQDRNLWEAVREMVVDVQVDADLDKEDSGLDETGLGALMLMVAIFVASLRGPDQTWIAGMVDAVQIGSLEPDDRSTPDDGRMTRALTVLYRVRSDDENVLLAAGVNG